MADTPTAAEVQQALGGMDYPATKEELCEHAKNHHADERVMNFLERIPEKEYSQPTEVSEELSELTDASE